MTWKFQKVTLVVKWNDEKFVAPEDWDWDQLIKDGADPDDEDIGAQLSDYSKPFKLKDE